MSDYIVHRRKNRADKVIGELVRCKECRYWNTSGCRDGVGECEWAYYMTKPDDFCSYGQKGDENVETDNLEWVTKSENMNHAYRTGLQRNTRNGKVRSVVCLNDGKFFGTISEASEYYGVSKSQIYWCCRRESTKCKLRFRFREREGE